MKNKIIVKEFLEETVMTCEGGNCELPLKNTISDTEKVEPSKKEEK